jgi:uncharacterized protein YndB with AHSA1/START domain
MKPRANTVKTTFSRETSVAVEIKADPAIIWALLTNAADYTRWNTTIVSLEGEIKLDNVIKLRSTLDPKRTFKLKIKEMDSENRMVWGDSQGNRIYTLSNQGNGIVRVSMTEKIGGLMFPLYAKYIPPFDQAFEQFVTDLKRESESIQSTKN